MGDTARANGKMLRQLFQNERRRLMEKFKDADPGKLDILDALIEQAAWERAYLQQMNSQAQVTGLVKIHPDDPSLQKALPISGEIARHGAALTNITDKLMKHLATDQEEDDIDFSEYG